MPTGARSGTSCSPARFVPRARCLPDRADATSATVMLVTVRRRRERRRPRPAQVPAQTAAKDALRQRALGRCRGVPPRRREPARLRARMPPRSSASRGATTRHTACGSTCMAVTLRDEAAAYVARALTHHRCAPAPEVHPRGSRLGPVGRPTLTQHRRVNPGSAPGRAAPARASPHQPHQPAPGTEPPSRQPLRRDQASAPGAGLDEARTLTRHPVMTSARR